LVTYTATDDCLNTSSVTATLTLEDSIGPDLTACTVVDETIECNGTDNETIANDWNAANILALQSCGTDSCDTDAVFDVTSDYAFTNLASTCGAGGTITVIYTVSDDCDNETTLTATLTLEDSIGPDLTACTVVDETIECNGTDNETIANDWNAANILALQSCGTDSCDADATFDVTSDYAFTNLASTCGAGGTITVIYTVSDDCDNETTLTATLTLEDSIGP
ncbi:gliding motility-associated C-terminal domain-containing protein, partial [Oceanihabitans sp. 2_MG-2023]|nr:gliding motility-associated C-terminal domain-containing protein [Oceanihabitans sp. 2_MG-2023]